MKIGKIAAVVMAIALVAGVARNARAQAQTLEAERAAEDLQDAEAAAKRHRAELMKIPHVRVVTGEVDGQGDAAILVEVDEQKNVDGVTRQLPSQIEGFPVEVDEGDGAEVESSLIGTGASPAPPMTISANGYGQYIHLRPRTNPDTPQ
jgi:hypothetical protein